MVYSTVAAFRDPRRRVDESARGEFSKIRGRNAQRHKARSQTPQKPLELRFKPAACPAREPGLVWGFARGLCAIA
jgi:hypothetical protein